MIKIYQLGTAVAACLLLGLNVSSQTVAPPPPPVKNDTGSLLSVSPDNARDMMAPEPVIPPVPEVGDQGPGVIIRQTGKKNAKITVELHGGDVTINGKPIDQFKDKTISVTRIPPAPPIVTSGEDEDFSLFRQRKMDQAQLNAMQSDLQKQQHEVQIAVNRAMRDRERVMHDQNRRMSAMFSNGVYLGVASKKSDSDGAVVMDITPASPAEKAGLKKGDVITKVNGKTVHTPDELYEAIHQLKVGDKVKVTLQRDGKEQIVTAVLEKSKDSQVYNYNYNFKVPEVQSYRGWGEEDSDDQPKLGLKAQDNEDGKGVDVLDVVAGSAAEKAGLKKGDNIVRFNGDEVNSAEELVDKVADARGKGKVSLSIIREGKSQDLDLHIPRKVRSAEL